MHAAIVHLTPVFAAEKSKTPFYIAGGLLVAWALILSMVIGMRNVSFPATVAAERAVMAVTAVLVVLTASMAIATSGGSTEKATAAPEVGAGKQATPTPASGASSSALKESADPGGQLRFTAKDLTAKAGAVKIDFENSSPLPHDMTISKGTQVLGGTPIFQGGSKTLTLNLKPGTYTFYCSVPGHRAAGMEGTLTVQ